MLIVVRNSALGQENINLTHLKNKRVVEIEFPKEKFESTLLFSLRMLNFLFPSVSLFPKGFLHKGEKSDDTAKSRYRVIITRAL